MLLPRFSIRQLLWGMIGLAAISACFAGATRGNVVAFGLGIGAMTLVVPVLAATVGYWILFGLAKTTEILFPVQRAAGEVMVAPQVFTPTVDDQGESGIAATSVANPAPAPARESRE